MGQIGELSDRQISMAYRRISSKWASYKVELTDRGVIVDDVNDVVDVNVIDVHEHHVCALPST